MGSDPSTNSRTKIVTPRMRAIQSLRHQAPDRVPVDFLATPEVWSNLIKHFAIESDDRSDAVYFEKSREKVLQYLDVDCRVLSYDMFLSPPPGCMPVDAKVDWWNSLSRSTPNRMWRQVLADGTFRDIWGRRSSNVENSFGAYEEFIAYPLSHLQSIEDLKHVRWPEPDWWNFSDLPGILADLDCQNEYHIRFRAGSVFEVAWQLRGMEAFLLDLITEPRLAAYIMDSLTDVSIANLQTVLELDGGRIDMIYFYDDVATQNSLLISKKVWRNSIRPRHQRIVDLVHKYGKQVMYHCDGAISYLLPELIEMGIDVINPVQVDAGGMAPDLLKEKYGSQLSFHGGVDIIKTLRTGSPAEVQEEVKDRIRLLGKGGGYILASSHHIQPDTPVENILAMYDPSLR